jgi:ATP-dependent RNA helicase RhlE
MTFNHLPISKNILKALKDEGYDTPTPIQEQAIPVLFEGKDVLGSAQTGTGKTAAFAIPILQRLSEKPRTRSIKALILAPTRELAAQIDESFKAYGNHLNLKTTVVFGGVSQRSQEIAIRRGTDILVATPGRLLDLIGQKIINISEIEYFVLDEADRMLDMGFIHDVKKIIENIPNERQTMLFSATLPKEILELSKILLKDPVRISVVPVEATLDSITQKLYKVIKANKINLLAHLLSQPDVKSALVFTRTKHYANKLMKSLTQMGFSCDAIHGNKSQTARTRALADFKKNRTEILVATDIAARGLDIEGLTHVVNFDLPEVPETYIHRIGRTGRAGFSGTSISFQAPEEAKYLRDIERHIHMKIPLMNYDMASINADLNILRSKVQPPKKEPKKKEKKKKIKFTKSPNQTEPVPTHKDMTHKKQPTEQKRTSAPSKTTSEKKKPTQPRTQSASDKRNRNKNPMNHHNDQSRSRSQTKNPQRQDKRKPQASFKPTKRDLPKATEDEKNIINGKVIYRYNRHDFHYNRDAIIKSEEKNKKQS